MNSEKLNESTKGFVHFLGITRGNMRGEVDKLIASYRNRRIRVTVVKQKYNHGVNAGDIMPKTIADTQSVHNMASKQHSYCVGGRI